MSTLYIGDMHAKADELDECHALHRLILDTVAKHKPDRIVYLGDQYHTHAIVNTDVQAFWLWAFDSLAGQNVFALVGNHDKPGDRNSQSSAMQVHTKQVRVVDSPVVDGKTLFLPYYHDLEALVSAAQAHPECDELVCHQTFEGAKYEGGFFAKGAVDQNLVPQKRIISGHIHSPAQLGKVWYPGSPRWFTIADANVERFLYLIDGDNVEAIPTALHCRVQWQLTESPSDEVLSEQLLGEKTKAGDKITINLQGSRAWCEQRKLTLASFRSGLRFRSFPTDGPQARVKESDGIAVAWKKHCQSFRPKNSTPKDVLLKMAEERIHV